ncbi:MAG TPA: helix-turn-helix domain-containing protein [Candidatus Saccharimonadales bacterium]
MLTDTATIRTYFAKLGLEPEIADLYLALHTYGPQTISELSRNSKVERTRIYRLIDRLMETSLVELESRHKRGVIKAAPIANLRILIAGRENELKNLQDELGLIEQILARNSLSSPAVRVQFYAGSEGARQLLWNALSAKNDIIGYICQPLHEPLGQASMDRWAAAFEESKLHARLLLNKSRQEDKNQSHINGIDYGQVDESTLKITHTCVVYDSVVAYLHWKDGEVFGTETHNKEIADTQRNFLEPLWPQLTPESYF